jgi:hypothetical protein
MSSEIPNVIYSFWHSTTDIPVIVRLCLASWCGHNPDYEIVFLSPTTSVAYLPSVPNPPGRHSWPHYADLLRFEILNNYGGFWLDASLYLTTPLEWVHAAAQGKEFVGFTLGPRNRSTWCLENWFIACKPRCRFMQLWHDDFAKYRDTSIEAFVDSRLPFVDNIWYHPYYLAANVSAAVVLKHCMTRDEKKNTLALFRAEDGPGALWGLRDRKMTIKNLPKFRHLFVPWKMIKFTSSHRKLVDCEMNAKQRVAFYEALRDALPRLVWSRTSFPNSGNKTQQTVHGVNPAVRSQRPKRTATSRTVCPRKLCTRKKCKVVAKRTAIEVR